MRDFEQYQVGLTVAQQELGLLCELDLLLARARVVCSAHA